MYIIQSEILDILYFIKQEENFLAAQKIENINERHSMLMNRSEYVLRKNSCGNYSFLKDNSLIFSNYPQPLSMLLKLIKLV
jgi:hypothetical protein